MPPRLATGAAVIALAAGPAFAGDAVVARLAKPLAEKTKFIAGGAMFVCESDTCIALAPTSTTFGLTTCKVIAARVGAVATFSRDRPLDDRKLADCNNAPSGGVARR